MTKCKYILELPGGGSIELPASFGTLERDEKIDTLFDNYQSTNEDDKKSDLLNELRELVKTKTPKGIHGNTINSLIRKSNSVDALYENLNNIIVDLGNYDNIGDAIYNYIKESSSKKGTKNQNLEKLRIGLNQERSPKYFKNIGIDGIIGTTNLKAEKNRIYAKDIENKEFGFPNIITSNLNTFLNGLIHNNPKSDSNVLYGSFNSFIGKAWSDENIVLYELDDDLSLFLGLFKREAVKINKEKLIPIIQKINELVKFKKYGKIELPKDQNEEIDIDNFDLEKFFIGSITDKKITPSKFEELLEKSKDQNIAKEIDNILKEVANNIRPDDYSFSLSIRKLFWMLSPNSYGKNSLFKQINDKKITTEEAKIEQIYKQNRLSFIGMKENERKFNFSAQEIINDDHYNNAIKNITINKDLVRFPIEKSNITIYGLVTHIYKRDNGVMIYGVYKNQDGNIETLKYLFNNSDEIIYRNREEVIQLYNPNEQVLNSDGILVTSNTLMSQKLVKQIVRKGDLVNGNLVLGVYPGYLVLQTPSGKIVENPQSFYSKIKSVRSAIAKQEMENEPNLNINHYIQVSNGEDLSGGDYFLFEKDGKKFYKRVLYTDEKNVYSWVTGKNSNDAIIKATSKEGLKGLKDAYGELSPFEISKIQKESNLIGRSKAEMSSFTDINTAKKGDVFFFRENNVEKFGKILDNDKVLIVDGNLTTRIIKSLKDLKNVKFLTDRDISSNYSLFTLRVNSNLISFKSESDSPLDVEVIYTVPSGTDLNSITLLTNGYANIGTYKREQDKTEDELDITSKMLEALDQKGNKIFFEKESSNSIRYVKNTDSLTWIKYFNDLDYDTKNQLDILQPGTYFSVYRNETDIDFNIYRIISVDGNIIKAHVNKTSTTGDIITTEVDFTKEQLLNSSKINNKSTPNSIARLYMQNGNNKMSAVIKETNNLNTDRELTNKSIDSLIDKFKDVVKGLDIEIALVDDTNNFEIGQKAKIETNEEGKTSILINNKLGKEEDVVHEFLHLFLTPLRYRHPEIYNSLIQSVVKDTTLNVTQAEEEFVKYISKEMIKNNDFIDNFEDLDSFVKSIELMLYNANNSFDIKSEDNPITLLNTSLIDLFNINTKDTMSPLYNLAMITTEPMMREWMNNNNIILNCS